MVETEYYPKWKHSSNSNGCSLYQNWTTNHKRLFDLQWQNADKNIYTLWMYRVQLQLGVTSIRLRDACHTSTHPIQINMVYNIDIMCSFPRCDSYLLNDNFVYGTKRKMNSLLMAGQLLV